MITPELTNGHLSAETQGGDVTEEQAVPNDPPEQEQVEGASFGTEELPRPESLDQEEMKSMLEAMLFVSHEPLTLDKMAAVLEDVPKPVLKTILQGLQTDYDQPGRGLQIVEIAGGYQCVTRPEYGLIIKRLMKNKTTTKLSRSALETLAIIGYKQPLTRAEIEKIRGVETSGVLRTLLDQKLVRIVGRQDVPGRPILYGTGKHFLQRFGLRSLRDLPPLKEIKELGGPEQASFEFLLEADEAHDQSQVKDMSA